MMEEGFYQNFGALLKKRRESMALSQTQLGKKLNLSRATIANIERGKQQVYLHQFIEFARSLNIQAIELLPEVHARNVLPENATHNEVIWLEKILKVAN